MDASDHSASEKKAGWRKSLDGGSKTNYGSFKSSNKGSNKGSSKRILDHEGDEHYAYRSVKVDKDKDQDDVYTISNKNGSFGIRTAALREFEEGVEEDIVAALALANGTSFNEVMKEAKKDPGLREDIKNLIDEYAEEQLSNAITNINAQNKASSTPKQTNSKAKKPKYTQEEAMAKAYDDLEKMYPNFYDLPQDTQDQMWIDYMNESGLYKYT